MSPTEPDATPVTGAAQATPFPRPLPKLEGDAAPFWQALRAGRIDLPRCRACGGWVFYPRSFCPRCSSRELDWKTVDGQGRVYTFTVVHKPTHPWFASSAPYVYALVELEVGVRLPTIVVECRPEDVRVGSAVAPVFEKVSEQVTLLHFRLRAEPGSGPQQGPR
jgi:hypothetical protein